VGDDSRRFLLIYPPSKSFFIETRKIFYGMAPPLGLLHIARVLEDEGDDVTILDFSAEKFDDKKLLDALESVDVVGITILTVSLSNAIEMISLIKKAKPEIPVIIGGPHCTLFPKKVLEETQADICVQGDGEKAIRDIKKALNDELNYSEISGVFYMDNQEVKQGQPVQLITDLNAISSPARHLVKKYEYGRGINPHIKKGEFTSVVTSRGCPFTCRFCSRNSMSMKKYRMRSTENIIEELKEIYKMGYKYVAFNDDCFLSNKKQAVDLFKEIIEERFALKFYVTAARVDSANEELYFLMKKAGVCFLQFGLESGNQDVLDFYNKNITIEQSRYAVNLSHRMGFFTAGSFILGAPFETEKHFEKTVSFAKSLSLNSVSFLPLVYMVGSELWSEAVDKGKTDADSYLVQADSSKNLGLFTKEQLKNYCYHAQRSFYARPTFVFDLFKTCVRQHDVSFLQAYLSFIFSN
jgi:radical SAM superfamily enzyme YgiQ (UPF0313 family)